MLVATTLLLNLTVATGTLNGLIFYANAVLANRSTFLPFSSPSFISVFIHLLNTQIGLDYCMYNGMNEYSKTWLSIGFPFYMLVLLCIVVLTSTYSSRCARFIGRSNPVAALATLILFIYEGLLQTIIDIFSFADLQYSDGSQKRVWRPDGSVAYLQGKHIPLFMVGMTIVTVVLAFTVLLFSWQWIRAIPDKKILFWARNTKLNSFIDTFNAPYRPKFRFWTGLLLFIRIVHSIATATNVSGNPRNNLLIICVLIVFVMMLKSYLGGSIYKSKLLDYLETALYFNLLLFTMASFYSLDDTKSQWISANISVSVAFVIFIVIMVYHIHCTLSKMECWRKTACPFHHKTKQTECGKGYDYHYEPTAKVLLSPTTSEVSLSGSVTFPQRVDEGCHDATPALYGNDYRGELYNKHSKSNSKLSRPLLLELH